LDHSKGWPLTWSIGGKKKSENGIIGGENPLMAIELMAWVSYDHAPKWVS